MGINLPGRTDNSVKNHWNSSMKKRVPELYDRYLAVRAAGYLRIPVSSPRLQQI